jgi:hypothetical protein
VERLSAALIFDRSFEVLLLGLGGAVLAVVLLRNVRKRAQVMRAGWPWALLEGALALAWPRWPSICRPPS